jgi:hypothetical protein
MITHFLQDALPLLECQKIIKTKGLSSDTQKECLKVLGRQSFCPSLFSDFTQWMTDQLAVAKKLGLSDSGLPISSDTIESLFGVVKHHGVGAIKDPNRIALHIPALCGNLTPLDVERALNISTEELNKLTGSISSLTKQRRQILRHPGTLEQLANQTECANMELLPRPKTRENLAGDPPLLRKDKKCSGPEYLGDIASQMSALSVLLEQNEVA